MYAVSSVFARGLGMRASTLTSTYGGRSLGEVKADSGKLSWASDGRKVTARLDLSVADPHGTLATPLGPLGWLGQQLVLRSGVSRASYEEMIPCGAYRIDDSGAAAQAWSMHRDGTVVRRGGRLSPYAVDLLSILEEDDLVGLEQPLTSGTIRTEAIRLVGDRIPVASSWPGVADPLVPASVTYDTNRLTSLCSLAAAVNAVVWVGRSRELQFIPQPAANAPAVWSATSERVVQIIIPGNRTGMYNKFIMEGTDANGAALRGIASVDSGPLAAVTSPFGTVTYRQNNPLMKTQAAIDAAAVTLRDNTVAQRTAAIKVTVPADPSLDPLDVVSITDPEGHVWTGPVTACEMPLEPGVMTLTIPVPLSAVLS
jgi:hypothetical protein